MNRKTRSILPCKESLYFPQSIPNMKINIENKNKKSKTYYDTTAKKQSDFVIGNDIWYKDFKNGWVKGKIKSLSNSPRSYWIELEDGTIYRRNGRFLRKQLLLNCSGTAAA